MRKLIWVAAVLALTACVTTKKQAKTEPDSPDLTKDLSIGCYTVDLFDPYRINYPKAGVSPENAKFLGVWKDGAWDKDEWCHDLYITEVRADGSVVLLDAYGPNPNRGSEAVVFKRIGQIEDGVLSFVSGGAKVSYRVRGNFLVGQRVDLFSSMNATIRRVDGIAFVPIPPRRPRRT